MRILVLAFALVLLTGAVPAAKPQSVDAVTWDQSSPLEVKRYAEDACLNQTQVGVTSDDGRVVEGKVSDVAGRDFTVVPSRGAPVTVPFASVRRIRFAEWKESKAWRMRERVREIAAHGDLVAKVEPRHQAELAGHIGEVRELDFVLVEEPSQVRRQLAYRDLERVWARGIGDGPTALEVLRYVGLVAAGVAALPLSLLALLTGWDGC